jgi:hypothetical protein
MILLPVLLAIGRSQDLRLRQALCRWSRGVEVAAGVVLDFDAQNRLVGIDIDNASRVVDLETIEAEELPLGRLAAG